MLSHPRDRANTARSSDRRACATTTPYVSSPRQKLPLKTICCAETCPFVCRDIAHGSINSSCRLDPRHCPWTRVRRPSGSLSSHHPRQTPHLLSSTPSPLPAPTSRTACFLRRPTPARRTQAQTLLLGPRLAVQRRRRAILLLLPSGQTLPRVPHHGAPIQTSSWVAAPRRSQSIPQTAFSPSGPC